MEKSSSSVVQVGMWQRSMYKAAGRQKCKWTYKASGPLTGIQGEKEKESSTDRITHLLTEAQGALKTNAPGLLTEMEAGR